MALFSFFYVLTFAHRSSGCFTTVRATTLLPAVTSTPSPYTKANEPRLALHGTFRTVTIPALRPPSTIRLRKCIRRISSLASRHPPLFLATQAVQLVRPTIPLLNLASVHQRHNPPPLPPLRLSPRPLNPQNILTAPRLSTHTKRIPMM